MIGRERERNESLRRDERFYYALAWIAWTWSIICDFGVDAAHRGQVFTIDTTALFFLGLAIYARLRRSDA